MREIKYQPYPSMNFNKPITIKRVGDVIKY